MMRVIVNWPHALSSNHSTGSVLRAHLDTAIAVFSLSHDEGVGEGWGEGGPFRRSKQTGFAQRPLLSPTLSSIFWRRGSSVVSDQRQCQDAVLCCSGAAKSLTTQTAFVITSPTFTP